MDQDTAAKIKSHKWGRRKLATDSAWNGFNAKLRNKNGFYDSFVAAVKASPGIAAIIQSMNDEMTDALTAVGGGDAPDYDNNHFIAFPNGGGDAPLFIPRSVYYGYIRLPTGHLDDAHRTAFQDAETEYADWAGKLRVKLAFLYDTHGLVNDLGNKDVHPNPGGVGGLPNDNG